MLQVDFESIFNTVPMAYVVVDLQWRIVAVTDDYLKVTKRSRSELLGRNILEAFPDNPDDPDANGNEVLRSSLERAVSSGKVEYLPIQRYDIPLSEEEGGVFAERYWHPVNAPVFNAAGETIYVIHGSEDVTKSVLSGKK